MTSQANAIEALADILAPVLNRKNAMQWGLGEKHDTTGTPSAVGYLHGPGGLLSFPGVDPAVFTSAMGNFSLLSQLPTTGSPYTNPTYWVLTGVLADTGNEMDAVCDNAPVAGLMKACLQTSVFGRYERSTTQLDIGRLGERTDRSDPMDLRIIGTPLASQGGPFQGLAGSDAPSDLLTNEISKRLWERNISFYRLLTKQIWNGSPVNNKGAGGYKELSGLSTLVATGYKDAETGIVCPAADSYVSNFNSARIDANGTNTVAAIVNAYYQVKERALRTGVMPVRWVFAMRPQLFYELTAIWPCAYLTYRCTNASTSTPEMIDARDAVAFRDEMRTGKYLLIDGDRIEVVVDDGITELDGNSTGAIPRGCFSSDIYLLPMSVIGGQSTLYMEYFQYNNPSLNAALGADNMILGRIEGNGAFITYPRQTNGCFIWQTRIEPRLVLRTPWLAARIRNVAYCPIEHEREPFPTDPYLANGGRTNRVANGPSFSTLW